jgi:DNA-binding MarR family transcriptional regulator
MQDDRARFRSSLGFALVHAFRRVNRATSRVAQRYGLSAEQAHILLVLWLEGRQKIGDLQRLLELGSGTMTGAIDRMEAAKLVRRVRDPKDRRATWIEPHPSIDKRRREIIDAIGAMEEESFLLLEARERRELARLLAMVGQRTGELE